MGSMHTGLEAHPDGFRRMAAFYAERAKGGVGLIVTGGISPNSAGCIAMGSAKLSHAEDVDQHKIITGAVHNEGGKICLQILHTGRYGYHPGIVAPSAIQAPITPFKPQELKAEEIEETIDDYIRCARLAKEAGYDGVEIMGSEGYLINQFIAKRTNKREDEWGGSYENRIKFPLRIVKGIREACDKDFIVIYRLSMLDLVEDGSTWEEVEILAEKIEAAGASIINTGIGWHEARIPTIATMVPRGGFAWVTQKLMGKVSIPLITTNRINTPELAEQILAEGKADMVSMARPFLADADFINKALEGKGDEINTCIACNQACLDHIFEGKITSCLVNPRACHELELNYHPVIDKKKIAVVGAGPAGLAAATTAAQRGHEVHLFEAENQIGGQFNLAKRIPGKEEFYETIRYFQKQLELTGVQVFLGQKANAASLLEANFDEVIISTGITPRDIDIPGHDHPKVASYTEIITGQRKAGQSVAIVGSGGIGIDIAVFLVEEGRKTSQNTEKFMEEWGVDMQIRQAGGIREAASSENERKIFLLKRSSGKTGSSLGKTTGWIHRHNLRKNQVQMYAKVEYLKINDQGLHVRIFDKEHLLEVDDIIICAGQERRTGLYDQLVEKGIKTHIIGGAKLANQLDAKRAIDEGCRLAAEI